jgi:hypothetical protein
MLMQNCNDSTKYKVGTMEVDTPCHNAAFFVAKAAYILLWTYVLNMLCGKGLKTISWALVLLPLLGMFLMIGLVFIALLSGKKKKEGMDAGKGYGEQFETNPGVEGNLPPMPSEAPKEGFFEGVDECDQGQEKDADGNCVESFYNREGFREGMDCPEGEEQDENGECVPKGGAFTGMEGFQEGADDSDGEGMDDEDDEGFRGGENWPKVGQLL